MQRPDDKKRAAIIAAAVRQFSNRPFHEVHLDDIAAAARVGKGTVYIYFSSKEDLYDSIVLEAFDAIITQLRTRSSEAGSAWEVLSQMVVELLDWARANPSFYKMIMQGASDRVRPRLVRKRKQLGQVFEAVLKRGIDAGEFDDAFPELTAQYIPACVRASVRYGPARAGAQETADHLIGFLQARLLNGVAR
jgi:AcrR family transcriptional regulator